MAVSKAGGGLMLEALFVLVEGQDQPQCCSQSTEESRTVMMITWLILLYCRVTVTGPRRRILQPVRAEGYEPVSLGGRANAEKRALGQSPGRRNENSENSNFRTPQDSSI